MKIASDDQFELPCLVFYAPGSTIQGEEAEIFCLLHQTINNFDATILCEMKVV